MLSQLKQKLFKFLKNFKAAANISGFPVRKGTLVKALCVWQEYCTVGTTSLFQLIRHMEPTWLPKIETISVADKVSKKVLTCWGFPLRKEKCNKALCFWSSCQSFRNLYQKQMLLSCLANSCLRINDYIYRGKYGFAP